MTLRITGSNFVPESKVSIAVVNTFHWKVAAKGTTYAQRASTGVLCGHDFKVCLQPNPRAGTIAYRLRLSSAPSASDLAVLYRSAGGAGVQSVTLR